MISKRFYYFIFGYIALLFFSQTAFSQLSECSQINSAGKISETGGCINRTLDDQIGAGQGNANTPGSSVYLIKRDPARSIRRGRQLFQRKFTVFEGQGPRVNDTSTGDITATRILGAGLADSCAACHGRPRGSAGHGGDVVTFPDSRDAPHLFGLGLVEMLADEMTTDLRAIRSAAITAAQTGGGNGQTQVLINADFSSGTNGFSFSPDTFRNTFNPAYSQGHRIHFFGDYELRVLLGGIDNQTITGMSGGWSRSFTLSSPSTVSISFIYRLTQTEDYDPDEFSEALMAVDGNITIIATLTGNGDGGGTQSTDFKTFQTQLNLGAGTHTLTLGDYNNKKTSTSEFTDVEYDDVLVTATTGTPAPVTRELITKGIRFGSITAHPDGSVNTSAVVGVDKDLRIKPFFAQGATISMREFIVGAFKAEMGLESFDPVLCAATDPVQPQMRTSASGFVFNPALDTFERPPVCSANTDNDNDGVRNEIDAALVDHMEFYLLNYFKPGQYRVTSRAQQGLQLMQQIGCTSCHVQNLTINRDRRIADIDTVYNPTQGIFNALFATATLRAQEVNDGNFFPQVLPLEQSFVVKNFFSDLKRHDLGANFEERDFNGNRIREHVTEPLWGVATTAPYGHDGRSINLDTVIRRHGGEAVNAASSYKALSDDSQRKIQEFLGTLVLFPPDDTASNLNPGNPNAADPQNPANHGSINLGALFRIISEGNE